MKSFAGIVKGIIVAVYVMLVGGVILDLTVYSLHTTLHDVLQTAADSLEKVYYLPNIILVLIGTVLLTLLMMVKIPAPKKWVILLSSGVILVFKIIVGYLILFKTNWDAGYLYAMAFGLSSGGRITDSDYFSFFPNNIIALAFFKICITIAREIGVYAEAPGLVLIMAVNSLFVILAGVLLYDIVEYYSEGTTAFKGWIIYILFIGSSPWAMIPYTDSLGFVFPILVLWCYLKISNQEHYILKWSLIVLFTYWGYKIKGPALLVCGALVIYTLIKTIRGKEMDIKRLLTSFVAMILVLVVSTWSLTGIIRSTGIDYDKEKDTGVGFLIMVGLSPWNHGTFNEFDYSMLTRYRAGDEFQNEVRSRITERIRSYGLKGLVVHQLIKTMIIFNDGTFAWGAEGDFYKEPLSEKHPVLTPLLKDIFWNDGEYFEAYATIMQMIWITLIFGMLLYAFFFRKEKDESIILLICVILMILFAESVESRARYLYTFAPIFCVTGTLGINKLSDCVLRKQNDR